MFGHAEAFLDAPQLVVSVDDELGRLADEAGGVALLAVQRAGFNLQRPVHRFRRTDELDVSVAFERGFPVDGALGFGYCSSIPRMVLRARSYRYW